MIGRRLPQNKRWIRRPEGSNWGMFGDDDQIGRLNLITPQCRINAAAEIREGLAFALSLPLDYPGGNYHGLGRKAPELTPLRRGDAAKFDLQPNIDHPDVFSDEHVTLFPQFSTQWDALRHGGSIFDADGLGPRPTYYNGFHGGEFERAERSGTPFNGANHLSIDTIAQTGLQGCGVMIDLLSAFGSARRIVGYDDLMETMEVQRVTIESGDILCLHTGQAAAFHAAGQTPPQDLVDNAFCHLDGTDEKLLKWIDDSNIAALAADNFAVEAVPARSRQVGKALEGLHELCLFKLGLPLGELWLLSELAAWLAAHSRTRFMLTAPPLRLPGAVGSPVTPVATV